MSLVLPLLSSTWAVRWVGMHAALDRTAMDYRTQARVDEIMPKMRPNLTPAEKALRDALLDDAIRRVPARTGMRDEWTQLIPIEGDYRREFGLSMVVRPSMAVRRVVSW